MGAVRNSDSNTARMVSRISDYVRCAIRSGLAAVLHYNAYFCAGFHRFRLVLIPNKDDASKGFTKLRTNNWFSEKIVCETGFMMDLSLLGGVVVIVIFVFCVLAVVMAALRPSVFSSFVRGFRGEDAKSDEEMQEQIKSINWKKGFFRLTLVLSILFGIFAGIANGVIYDSGRAFLVGFFAFFGLVWLIYFAISFVIKGFASKK